MGYDYGRLGERQRGVQLPVLEILSSILLLIAIVLGMLELVRYSDQRDTLPTDLTVAGIAVGGLSETDARTRWESIYVEQPIQLSYEGSPIVMYPSEINFRVNSDAMLATARDQSSRENNFWAGFWNYLESRPVAAVSVPLDAGYLESDLRKFLEDVAARYDAKASNAGFDLNTLTFSGAMIGQRLDIDAAIPLIDRALYDPEPANRRIVLPTTQVDAAQVSMNTLHDGIIALMTKMGFDYEGSQTLASVYVMDLKTGAEVNILSDVVHSAKSVIKIPIMINVFRKELLVSQDEAFLLTESILCSNNASSNLLIQTVGAGDAMQSQMGDGLNQVSCTAQALGAQNTFMSAPLFVGDTRFEFSAPVCRPDTPTDTTHNTNADQFSQTTARDMGVLLTSIYDCAEHGSGLMAIFPDDITQTECQQMINLLSGNRIDRLIELGLPLGTQFAHKNGWGGETSADAGIVFSPGGDYVISIFTWELDTDGNDLPTLLSWEVIEEISRMVYNFFNPTAPLTQARAPLNPYGAIDCVTASSPDLVDLNDINKNRLDANGLPLPDACYGGYGHCKPFDNWGTDR